MSGGCCGSNTQFDGSDQSYIRVLWLVILINASMFVVEITAGFLGQSQALKADALDFLGDTLTYGVSLWAIGKSLKVRSTAAVAKGISLLFVSLWVCGGTLYRVFILHSPDAAIMGGIASLAFFANLVCVFLLIQYKDGDSNVRSVWLCSRNDAIGNLVVLIAASGVWVSESAWPDLIVALVMAGLFLSSAFQIIRQALMERRSAAVLPAKS